jgi:autotransporter strand-loop-strand O-heptosyltransferase
MIVKIDIDYPHYGLGDTICILPYVEMYRQTTNNEVWFKTKFSMIKELVVNTYPSIKFGDPDIFDKMIVINFRHDVPMQKTAADQLGLHNVILDPKFDRINGPRYIKQKYVTLSMQSTLQNRYWNYKNGWDILIKELNTKYKLSVVCIDKFSNFGNGKTFNETPKKAINRTGVELKDAINYIEHAEFHIGLSSGLSWVAHAVGKPVVIMKSATEDWFEFQGNMITVNNESVCHGCLNRREINQKENGMWNFCPEHSGTNRMFECSKSITPKMFLDKMQPLLKNYI